jgi:hypothetical protein
MSNDIYQTVSLKTDQDKKMMKGFIDEAVNAKIRAKMEAEAIRDIRNEAKEKLGISTKVFNKIVGAVFKDSITKEKQDYDEFETVVETLYPSN